uniref:Uncharacterized protein n=1 Tax=Petromyzon marinus TaxID=7757 RepID=S4RFD0_PETMA
PPPWAFDRLVNLEVL